MFVGLCKKAAFKSERSGGMKNNRFQVQALKLKKWDYLMIAGASLSILVLMVVFQLYTTNAKASQIELVEDVI